MHGIEKKTEEDFEGLTIFIDEAMTMEELEALGEPDYEAEYPSSCIPEDIYKEK